MSSQTLREAAEASKAWPFEEARKLIARLERAPRSEVIFETGYGPSGLPHLGTFGEVAFDYEFMSSTETYQSGRFDKALLRVLDCFDEVQAIMLPSLREERAAT